MIGKKLSLTTAIVVTVLLGLLAAKHLMTHQTTPDSDLSPVQAKKIIEANQGNEHFYLIDIRTLGEFGSGHLSEAINIDFGSADFEEKMKAYDSLNILLLYCRSGNRSRFAIRNLSHAGFKGLYHIAGGIVAWEKAGYSIEK